MKIVGIVAEFNPFHRGHAYLLNQVRNLTEEETAVVCVMSGNWVQRGECAIFDKWTRTRAALSAGTDLVLELPTPWAAASAETFAQGSVGLLAASGVVDTLAFGSECGEIEPLFRLARCLNSPEFHEALRSFPNQRMSFASRRQAVAEQFLGPECASLLGKPNNNLAVEYLRALPAQMDAVTIPRQGPGHDSEGISNGYASASQLRQWILAGQTATALPYLTSCLSEDAASLQWCERAVLARLRSMSLEEFQDIPDSGEGLAVRLLESARQAKNLTELYDLAKTKRFAHARIRRLALWAFLGLKTSDRPSAPPYLRVLGFSSRGQTVLRKMSKQSRLPILVKSAHIRRFSPKAQALFQAETRCSDLYGLCFSTPKPGGMEWTASPVRQLNPTDTCDIINLR